MKSKDTLLLEEAYVNILTENKINLLKEGKVKDFLKTNYNKLKGALTNPTTVRMLTTGLKVAAPIIMALASGNIASAAEGLSNLDLTDMWQQFSDLMQAGDTQEAKEVLQNIDSSLFKAWKAGQIEIDNPQFNQVADAMDKIGVDNKGLYK